MPMTLGNSDTLFIRIGKDKIIFARYDRIKDSTLNYSVFLVNKSMSLNANMHQALSKQPLVKGDFSRVHVSIDCSVILVPLNEFDDEDMHTLYAYNLPAEAENAEVFYDMLPLQNATMLGCIDKDLQHTLLEAFPNATFHSTQMPLLLHFASLSQGVSSAGKMFVLLGGEQMTLAAFRQGKISLLNTYRDVKGINNLAYYIMAFAKQWDANAVKDEVYLVEGHADVQNIQTLLKTYMPNVFTLRLQDEFNRHVLALAKHLPYDMITLLLNAY